MLRKFLILAFLFLFALNGVAQSDISMATHWYNRTAFNPASIVRPDYLYLFTNARKQWTGIEGAPALVNLQASAYYNQLRSGFGFSFINDNVGQTKVFNPTVLYAHVIGINENTYLSMGLSAGVFVRTLNSSKLEAETIIDPVLTYTDKLTTKPDANLGFELQSKYFIFGLSTTHLFTITGNNDFFNTNHRYGYAYYKNSDNNLFNILLGAHVSNRHNFTIVEGHSMIRLKYPTGLLKGPRELLDIGASWRSTKQLTLLITVGIRYSKTNS